MKIADCMSRNVEVCAPEDSIRDIAQKMRQLDCGVVPIGENDRLVGVVTDRDIAVRAVAEGRGPDTPAREVMSQEILYCYDDQDLEEVTGDMSEMKVRRMPVVDRDKRLVGIISLGDMAHADGRTSMFAFQRISEPGGPHDQSAADRRPTSPAA